VKCCYIDYEVIGFSDYLLSGPDITMHHSNSPFITHFVAQFVAQFFGRHALPDFLISPAGAVITFPPSPLFFFSTRKGHEHGSGQNQLAGH
jgi:hypothetical protein